jgi:hypothetical protein
MMIPFDLKSENDLGTFYGLFRPGLILRSCVLCFLNMRFGGRFLSFGAVRAWREMVFRFGGCTPELQVKNKKSDPRPFGSGKPAP